MMMISMLEGEINLQAVVIANVLGFGLMLIVMLNKRYRRKIITLDDKLYNWMCYLCMVLCLVRMPPTSSNARREMRVLEPA